MTTAQHQAADRYRQATSMIAIGMTEKPEIGAVTAKMKMLEVPTPRPMQREVAIELRASSLHIDEIYAAQGTALGRFYGPKEVSTSKPYLFGSSVSGVVVGLGEDASHFAVGDEVIVIPNEKGEIESWATYRCVDESMVMAKPAVLGHVEAAAVTMAACVALGSIERSRVEPGDRCVVVGASGSIGSLVLQFLKSEGCHVTAVCSTSNKSAVKAMGADKVIDYTKFEFGEYLRSRGELQDVVFDCVGGKEIERNARAGLKRSGVFATVVGPQQYIGEKKLSRWEFIKIMGYIVRRMIATRFVGPRYVFAEKYPRKVIAAAMSGVVEHEIRMPVESVIPFEIEPVVEAVELLATHRSKGRTVIDFTLPVSNRAV